MAARRVNQTLIYLVLIIASILYLLPVYVVLVTSLRSIPRALQSSEAWSSSHSRTALREREIPGR